MGTGPGRDSLGTTGWCCNLRIDHLSCIVGPERVDLFVTGLDQATYHKAWDGSEWLPSQTDWYALG